MTFIQLTIWHLNLHLSQNSHALSYAKHTFKFLHNIKYALTEERDIKIHVIHLKKK